MVKFICAVYDKDVPLKYHVYEKIEAPSFITAALEYATRNEDKLIDEKKFDADNNDGEVSYLVVAVTECARALFKITVKPTTIQQLKFEPIGSIQMDISDTRATSEINYYDSI